MTLFELISKSNLTQTELAKLVGVRQQTVSKWCKKKSTPTLLMMKKLATILQVDVTTVINSILEK